VHEAGKTPPHAPPKNITYSELNGKGARRGASNPIQYKHEYFVMTDNQR